MHIDIVMWIVGGLLVNALLGAAVLAAADDAEKRLYRWYSSAPRQFGGLLEFAVLEAWPVVLWLWKRNR